MAIPYRIESYGLAFIVVLVGCVGVTALIVTVGSCLYLAAQSREQVEDQKSLRPSENQVLVVLNDPVMDLHEPEEEAVFL